LQICKKSFTFEAGVQKHSGHNEEKWFYLLKNLHKFDRIPSKLQAKIFKKVFKIAEIAKYSADEKQRYIDSLKFYLDLKNSLDYAKYEGKIEIIIEMIKEGMNNELIYKLTKISIENIDKIRNELNDK